MSFNAAAYGGAAMYTQTDINSIKISGGSSLSNNTVINLQPGAGGGALFLYGRVGTFNLTEGSRMDGNYAGPDGSGGALYCANDIGTLEISGGSSMSYNGAGARRLWAWQARVQSRG